MGFQVEYLTAALSVTYQFMDIGNEYSHSDSRILSGSLRLLSSQFVDSLCSDAVDALIKMLKKDLWEVPVALSCRVFWGLPYRISGCPCESFVTDESPIHP